MGMLLWRKTNVLMLARRRDYLWLNGNGNFLFDHQQV